MSGVENENLRVDRLHADAKAAALGRFFTATSGAPATDQQKQVVSALRDRIIELALVIELHVPDGRNKSLALTALEDVQMRANRGIFA
jgi:hypothetical protein